MFIFWPQITRWIHRFMARRAEDMVRKMAGMPSRKEEERRRKQQEKRQRASGSRSNYSRDPRSGGYAANPEEVVHNMQQYAEDVEFVETKEYSETEIREDDTKGNERIYRESQVSDVEYIEIKDNG